MARRPSTFVLLLLVLFVADVAAAGIKVPVHRGETATFFVTTINRSATQGEAVFRSAPFDRVDFGACQDAVVAPF